MGCIVVTGAAGFLGQQIAEAFCNSGEQVVAVDRNLPKGDLPSLGESRTTDVRSRAFGDILAATGCDMIVHAAAPASVPLSFADPEADFTEAVGTFYHLLETVRRVRPACRVVLVSSAAVYGNPSELPISEDAPLRPISPYGYHKLLCEEVGAQYRRLFDIRVCFARVFSAYGPGLRRQLLWDICEKAHGSSEVRLWGTGRETRDLLHARDVASGIVAIARGSAFDAEAYNLASGEEASIHNVATRVLAQLPERRALSFSGEGRRGDPSRWRADISRIRQLGFVPTVGLDEGLKDYVEWALRCLQWVR